LLIVVLIKLLFFNSNSELHPAESEMVFVQGGAFSMGCTSEQSDCSSDEQPVHKVTVNSFNIGKYEVTQAQWEALMGANPSSFKGDKLPVENVSWDDVQEFIRRLNAATGKQYRLPTEAEWEYTARGGDKSKGYRYSGNNNIDNIAWSESNSGSATHAVGTKQANELGIYDMSGNVWEWCNDWYGDYSTSTQTNPTGPASGSYRVFRGGSWGLDASRCRVTYRSGDLPGSGGGNRGLGFRLVLQDGNSNQTTQNTESSSVDNSAKTQPAELEMVFVQGGKFTMGCTSEQYDCKNDEKPLHQVILSSFNIGKYEVTQAQWKAIMGYNPSYFTGDKLPVEMVSWDDAQEFIYRLNAATGKRYRLPTEAEWEYAARGGDKSKGYRYSGGNNIDNIAWYDNNADSTTHTVGLKQANELGIYDMSGNVYEWCSDWYGDYSSSTQTNPRGPATGSYRVIRGSSWNRIPSYCRVAFRGYNSPDIGRHRLGLRLVLQDGSSAQVTENSESSSVDNNAKTLPAEPDIVFVQGGTFTMGCTSEQGDDCGSAERPVHQVTVSSFNIGKYEVTQAQWKAIMGNNPSYFKGDKLPVEQVSWNDVQEFIRRLNAATGKQYRLPTEAEWEYAACGGDQRNGYKYSGGNNIGNVAWYDSNSGNATHAVGKKQANELGIYDMSGNVWEWCSDWYGAYSASAQTNPTGPASGSDRVVRGGGKDAGASDCRLTIRYGNSHGSGDVDLGFRLVLQN
jgi:formylglycine-generating enzyme required for sulfatase activity